MSKTTAVGKQDLTMENLIGMGIAAVVLIVLGILVFETWASQRQISHAAERESEEKEVYLLRFPESKNKI